eukprot:COSAG06_NODE_49994_length_321_cov_1.364865_2_plen_59_part_00
MPKLLGARVTTAAYVNTAPVLVSVALYRPWLTNLCVWDGALDTQVRDPEPSLAWPDCY